LDNQSRASDTRQQSGTRDAETIYSHPAKHQEAFIITNVIATVVVLVLVILAISSAPYAPATAGASLDAQSGQATASESVSPTPTAIPTATVSPSPSPQTTLGLNLNATFTAGTESNMLFTALISMLLAGALGALLCNLRGIFTYTATDRGKGAFPEVLVPGYYARPFIGAVTGVLVFFVGYLVASSELVNGATSAWTTLSGRLPYLAIAILAGFASHEFMQKMKEVAETLFQSGPSQRIEVVPNPDEPSMQSSPNAGAGGSTTGSITQDAGPVAVPSPNGPVPAPGSDAPVQVPSPQENT
jgi:hypothetical protein